jgi:uncharacterized protein YndB with AHSA1/START domain
MSRVTTRTNPLRLRVRVEALPDSVFKALTEPDSLTEWLTESAEVFLDDDRYEFWGRYVPQGEQARQRLLGHEPGRSLRLGWRFDAADASAVETVVELVVEPDADTGSLVSVTHTDVPTSGSADLTALHCFWHVSLGNLAAYCEGRPTAPPFDFTLPAQGEARVRTAISVPPDEVFASLLDPAQVDRWAGGSAVIEAQVGGRYDFGWDHGPVQITELEPDRVLAYSWRYPDRPDTSVRWELRGSRGHTFVTLVHSGFDDDRLAEEYRQGWPGYLTDLKRMLEVGLAWQSLTV